MSEKYPRELWEMAKDRPDLQHAIAESMAKDSGYYSIPTGNILLSVYDEVDQAQRENMIQAIKKARELSIKDLSSMLEELKIALTLEEAQGAILSPQEQTLKAIDINALATWTLALWLAKLGHTKRD